VLSKPPNLIDLVRFAAQSLGATVNEARDRTTGHSLDQNRTALKAGEISARIDRLPATRTIWTYIVLLSFGFFSNSMICYFQGMSHPAWFELVS
jgi:putative MFS transporter